MKSVISSRVVGVAFAVSLAMTSLGGDFVWTGGGVSGAWTDPANWGVASGYPSAGDVAKFESSATITSDFSIPEGELIVSNFNKSITFDCSISGAGKLSCHGDGDFHLKRDNFFTGGFSAEGAEWRSYGNESGRKNACRIHLYAGAGLGSGTAVI